ncbi:hypothetical protein DYB36_012508 [Aphanomyces astaci]|uniref:Peptidase A2 domain-containing protein n=1 Tax=Aphanomyces astaci TaxID=112090 RepID=A0A397BU87_APHAT|nr:hypothetical protein DYB36_012508 [Aphanomyces astaci]
MTGLPDSRHVDIEERIYPLTPAAQLQLKALRSQRKDVTHADIVRVVTTALKRPLTEADSILFDSPVDIDDPERWLDWFSTTLNTCEEGPHCKSKLRAGMSGHGGWHSVVFRNGIGAAELAGIGPYPDLQGTVPGVLAAVGLLAPSADGRARLKKRVSMEGAVMFYLPDLGVQLTLPLRDLEATRLHSHIWRVRRRTLTSRRRYLESATEGLDSGSAVIDPGIPPLLHESEAPDRRHDPRVREDFTRLEVAVLEVRGTVRSMDWPFQGLDESGFTVLLHSRIRDPYPLCGVMTGSLAPLVLATIDGHSTQALVDTGASITVISQEFWMLLGRPPLRTPSYGLVSAANAGISTLQRYLDRYFYIVPGLGSGRLSHPVHLGSQSPPEVARSR